MSVTYNGVHSIVFIESSQALSPGDTLTEYTSLKHTWNDFHLIPQTRPFIETPEANITMYNDTVSNKVFDVTDAVAGGQTFNSRKGTWDFYIDHDKWDNWYTAKDTIEDYINGKRLYCCLMDDYSTLYSGRFVVAGWKDGSSYSTATIQYYLDYEIYSLELDLNEPTSLSVSLDPNAPTFYTEDYINGIKPYVNAVVTYGSGKQKSVVIDDLTGIFQNAGTQNVTVSYTEKGWGTNTDHTVSSSVEITVVQAPDIYEAEWEDVRNSILRGDYATKYPVGSKVPIRIGNVYDDYAEVVGVNLDRDQNNTTIPLTFVLSKSLYISDGIELSRVGYLDSNLRNVVISYYDKFPYVIRKMIKSARKVTYQYQEASDTNVNITTLENIWIPSYGEVSGNDDCEPSDVVYPRFSQYPGLRRKMIYGDADDTYKQWSLRTNCVLSETGLYYWYYVANTGYWNRAVLTKTYSFPLGFCIGNPFN